MIYLFSAFLSLFVIKYIIKYTDNFNAVFMVLLQSCSRIKLRVFYATRALRWLFSTRECAFRSHINAWLQVASSLHFPFMKRAMDVNGTNVQKGYITILAGILRIYFTYSHFNGITMHIMRENFAYLIILQYATLPHAKCWINRTFS